MTAILDRPLSPTPGGLTPDEVRCLGAELDAIRQEVLDSRGARDAAYIRRLVRVQRLIELGSRAVLFKSAHRGAWLLGTAGLAVTAAGVLVNALAYVLPVIGARRNSSCARGRAL